MHSSRPLPSPASATSVPWVNRPSRHLRPGDIADLRAPFHAAKTIAARSVSVRDGRNDSSPIANVKNKNGTL